jgi:flagella basal body P-ring formation protein FlgA
MGMRTWYRWLYAVFATTSLHAAELDPSKLSAAVTGYLQAAAGAAYPDAEIEVNVSPVDARVTLAACDDLGLSHQPDRLYGRVSVAVKCRAPVSWTIYMTGTVTVSMPVVVTTRAVPRGSRIAASDLTLEVRDLATLRGDYLSALAQADGRGARRNLGPGSPLEARDLAPAIVVNRGERVQIASSRGGIVVTAPGEALRAGTTGEQIPVRNLNSDRLVQAWITGIGAVSTSPGTL